MGMPNRQRTAYSVHQVGPRRAASGGTPRLREPPKASLQKWGGGGASLVYSSVWCLGVVVGGGCFGAAVCRVCGALWSCGLGRCALRLCGTNCLLVVRECTALLPCVAALLCGRVEVNRLATVLDCVPLRCAVAVRDCTTLWQCGTAMYPGSEGLRCSVAARGCTALWQCGTAWHCGGVALHSGVAVWD